MFNIGTILLRGDYLNIPSGTKLQFLKIGKYSGKWTNKVDFSNCPRPFFSIGFILGGKGKFCAKNGESIEVEPGDIIVISTAATYVSQRSGSEQFTYITLHFIFNSGFNDAVGMQKITGCEHLKTEFEAAFKSYRIPEQYFDTLSIFYRILQEIVPLIQMSAPKRLHNSIKKAVDYITINYSKNISVAELAGIANLSPSRFFTVFKNEIGMTPIEYKNYICIQNAEKLLLSTELSMEEISEKIGFNSSTYFRRTFKKYVGSSPRDYKNSLNFDNGPFHFG